MQNASSSRSNTGLTRSLQLPPLESIGAIALFDFASRPMRAILSFLRASDATAFGRRLLLATRWASNQAGPYVKTTHYALNQWEGTLEDAPWQLYVHPPRSSGVPSVTIPRSLREENSEMRQQLRLRRFKLEPMTGVSPEPWALRFLNKREPHHPLIFESV
jgi:hypothetical protein